MRGRAQAGGFSVVLSGSAQDFASLLIALRRGGSEESEHGQEQRLVLQRLQGQPVRQKQGVQEVRSCQTGGVGARGVEALVELKLARAAGKSEEKVEVSLVAEGEEEPAALKREGATSDEATGWSENEAEVSVALSPRVQGGGKGGFITPRSREGCVTSIFEAKVSPRQGGGEGKGRGQGEAGGKEESAQLVVGKGRGAAQGSKSAHDSEPGGASAVFPIADSADAKSSPGGIASCGGGCEDGPRRLGHLPRRSNDPAADSYPPQQEDSAGPSGEGCGSRVGRCRASIVASPPRAKCVEVSPLCTPRRIDIGCKEDDEQSEGARTPSIYGDGPYLGWAFPSGGGVGGCDVPGEGVVEALGQVSHAGDGSIGACGDGSGGGPGKGVAQDAGNAIVFDAVDATGDIKAVGNGSGGGPGRKHKRARNRANQSARAADVSQRAWEKLSAELQAEVHRGLLTLSEALELTLARAEEEAARGRDV